jgi:predicted PurR-regulated permease PerM
VKPQPILAEDGTPLDPQQSAARAGGENAPASGRPPPWTELRLALWLAIIGMVIAGLIFGRELLLPLAVALLLWFIIDAMAEGLAKRSIAGRKMPRWLALAGALLAIGLGMALVVELVGSSMADISEDAPRYQASISARLPGLVAALGLKDLPSVAEVFSQIDLNRMIGLLVGTITGVAGQWGLILVYVLFMLAEERAMPIKLNAMFPNPERRREIDKLLHAIGDKIQRYIWAKTVMSFLTALLSYAVMATVGLEYAGFWALIVFLGNYIPVIGGLAAIVLPSLLALVQFETLTPVLIVGGGLTVVQLVTNNLVEPRYVGDTVNLSPLAVILSVAVWSSIWGLWGAFLCVPLTAILLIVLGHFSATRPVAVLLSGRGNPD